MSDDARAEAERRYRLGEVSRERSTSMADLNERVSAGNGFLSGAQWRAENPLPFTDEDVEAAREGVRKRLMYPSLHWPDLAALHHRDVEDALIHAALDAVTARHTKGGNR